MAETQSKNKTTEETKRYTHRFLARIVIEAATPLAVGSGEKDILSDALVATDVNGLPYIPGTVVAGVLRSMTSPDRMFGYHDKDGGRGSEIIFTAAKILNHEGQPVDGLNTSAIKTDPLLKYYQELPIRQHVRMSDKGVAEKSGKFDAQVVFAGTRFCFEVEMVSDGNDWEAFKSVLRHLYDKSFRIGGSTRNGFGEITVVDMKVLNLDLKKDADLTTYINKTSALNTDFWQKRGENLGKPNESEENTEEKKGEWAIYTLSLTPDSFFLFGSGFGDEEADMTPVKAKKVVWHNGKGKLEENFVLIPATSVKGALAHRVAFHWNRLNGLFADELSEIRRENEKVSEHEAVVGQRNPAVRALFGYEDKTADTIVRGNLIFSDLIQKPEGKIQDKLLNHVAIDRFTNAGVSGALFSEKVTYGGGQNFELTISVDCEGVRRVCDKQPKTKGQTDKVFEALKCALEDICDGMLPLGGGVNRGHGVFTGTLKIEKEEKNEDRKNQ